MSRILGGLAKLRTGHLAGERMAGERDAALAQQEQERRIAEEDRKRAIEREILQKQLLTRQINAPAPMAEPDRIGLLHKNAMELEGLRSTNDIREAKAKPPAGGGVAGLQVVQTPDGFTVVDKRTGTSRPVVEPGQTLGDGQLQPRVTGAGDRAIRMKAIDNRSRMRVIDEAIAKIRQYPKAVGLGRGISDLADQRYDPEGIPVRAAIADVGSLVVHDRSGAAVTAAEWPRLQPFIPRTNDTAEAVATKLERMKAIIEAETAELEAAGGRADTSEPPPVRAQGPGPGPNMGNAAAMQRIEQAYQKALQEGADPEYAKHLRQQALSRLGGGGSGGGGASW